MDYQATEYEGDQPLIVIWRQPYQHGGPAKDAIGWFTPEEASELLDMPPEQIAAALTECGELDTEWFSAEWT